MHAAGGREALQGAARHARLSRLPEGSEDLGRLARAVRYAWGRDPVRVAAAAIAQEDPLLAARLRWSAPWQRRTFPGGPSIEPDFEQLRHVFDLSDPSGQLDAGFLERLWVLNLLGGWWTTDWGLEEVERGVGSRGAALTAGLSSEWARSRFGLEVDFERLWTDMTAERWSARDRRRRFARTALKAALIPDRVRIDETGQPVLEVLDAFTWRPFDFDPPEPVREKFSMAPDPDR